MNIEKSTQDKAAELEMQHERYFGREVISTPSNSVEAPRFEIFTAFTPVRTICTAGIGK